MDGQDAERIRDPQDDLDLRAMPQPSRSDGDFEVTTNASEDAKAVEAKLMQNGHPVAYESKKLNSHQVNYSIHDKEMCVMNALERWQSFLLEKHFKIYTDHRSLVHFKTQSQGWQRAERAEPRAARRERAEPRASQSSGSGSARLVASKLGSLVARSCGSESQQ